MVKAGIVGASGYGGVVLVGLLLRHPDVKIEWATWETDNKSEKLSDIYPHLNGLTDIKWIEPDYDKLAKQVDVVFMAIPHGLAMNFVPKFISAGAKVIDFSADYRISDVAVFEKWYCKHTSPDLLKKAVFGLPEFYREKIKHAQLIANPGCYPTVSSLSIVPAIKAGLVDTSSIIIDAKSGVSGAGRSPKMNTHYPECNEGISAYAINNHRHKPEIEQILSDAAGSKLKISFTPHLTPMNRGILATVYANLKSPKSIDEIKKVYTQFYKDEYFVRVTDKAPTTKQVSGTNFCDIAIFLDNDTNRLTITGVIDNLVKGAAGQAVQNMNIIMGLNEKAGIDTVATYP